MEATTPGGQVPDPLQAVLARATTDRDFRRTLLTDPKRGIQDAFGVTLAADLRIKFVERGSDLDALIVLPEFTGDGELSDDELDSVAGGAPTAHQSWSASLDRGHHGPPNSAL